MTGKTVRVRVRVMLNAQGEWAAYGFTSATNDDADDVLYGMMDDKDITTARIYNVTAEIQLPEVHEIAATIDNPDGEALR